MRPVPASPKPPAVPSSLAGVEAIADLDPDYPDLDGVELVERELDHPDARTLSFLRSIVRDCTLVLPHDATIDAQDAVLVGLDLTGRRFDSGLRRVRFERCRLGGADFGEARLVDVTFDDCVLDLANFRQAQLERVAVLGGRLDGLDATRSQLTDVRLDRVALATVTLDGSRLDRVDIRTADLAGVADVGALKGATIDQNQAIGLALRLARKAGLVVADPPGRDGSDGSPPPQ